LVSRVWEISSGIGPFFLMAGRLFKFYANAGGKQLMPQCKQQVDPFLSMNNYTPLVISRNDKNKQLTLSQRKLALTAGNTLFAI
jgi:hypothetical protein